MKQTFASNTFKANTFASGTWRGVGVEPTVVAAPVCLSELNFVVTLTDHLNFEYTMTSFHNFRC
jgi:hypothetical protein